MLQHVAIQREETYLKAAWSIKNVLYVFLMDLSSCCWPGSPSALYNCCRNVVFFFLPQSSASVGFCLFLRWFYCALHKVFFMLMYLGNILLNTLILWYKYSNLLCFLLKCYYMKLNWGLKRILKLTPNSFFFFLNHPSSEKTKTCRNSK